MKTVGINLSRKIIDAQPRSAANHCKESPSQNPVNETCGFCKRKPTFWFSNLERIAGFTTFVSASKTLRKRESVQRRHVSRNFQMNDENMIDRLRKIALILAIPFVLYLVIHITIRSNALNANYRYTVGKFESNVGLRSSSSIFRYYIDGEEYRTSGGQFPPEFEKNIGKFYRIRYAVKFPETIEASPSEEITDTTAIFKAGFSKNDLNNIAF